MFERILVAVDGSSTANRGLEVAIALARERKAKLSVLYVLDESAIVQDFAIAGFAPVAYVDGMFDALRSLGRKVLVHAQKRAATCGIQVTPILAECLGESVAQVIVRQSQKLRSGLIVLGTHGRRGFARLTMGSDAEAVVRHATVPVLLVRSPAAKARRPARPTVASRPARKRGAKAERAAAA